MDKRGQGLSVNAIILIVLGIVILIVLIAGFTIGFNKFLPFLASNNVNTISTSCSVACSTGSVYEFCSLQRTLEADDIKDLPSGKDGVGTCFVFGTDSDYAKYGIDECPALQGEGECLF